MGVVIDSWVWEPKSHIFVSIFLLSFLSIFLLPFFSNKTHLLIPSSFLRFQSTFLFIYSLASVNEGIQSAFGEFEYAYDGVNREKIVGFLCVGAASSLFFGTFLGMLSDFIGPKRICVAFCFLHLSAAIWKIVTMHPSGWTISILLGLASSVFPVSFETWMVTEHGKLGYKQVMLRDTLWLMTFFESASFIGSQVLANLLTGTNAEKGINFPSIAVLLLAMIIIVYISRGWKVTPFAGGIKDYMIALNACILHDKKVWLIACAQASLDFSNTVFWILWAPTIVADGREVHLGLIYPCFVGARMLGSTAVPWFHSGFLQFRIEDCLMFAFSAAGFVFSLVAYDYQEIYVLVIFFCFFHVCVGILLPSLARLRTMYVPNELRGGMISLSTAPANAAVIFVLIQRGYFQSIENSTIMAFAAFGLFSAAGCMYLLKQKGKQPHQSWHDL